ncbi:MAG: histidinol dehydrogenase [Acidimicrobiales bacterium]|nr:histidinol dehydrogenase [Acidimicrobiales bacterium]
MALRRLDLRGRAADRRSLRSDLPSPVDEQQRSAAPVADIIAEVRGDGDAALRRLTRQFDGVEVEQLRVPAEELVAALERIPGDLRKALEVAHERIAEYHAHEAALEVPDHRSAGITVRHLLRPVGRAGCYAPGGRARYPSTVLMTATPARVAGVGQVVLCVPPGPDGRIDDASLAAAGIAGVDEVYRVGGAQAIAAMAYGTESIEPVDVVVGPGNRYVAEAKRQVSGVVGVASAFAGPSEVVVVADAGSPPDLCALDLLVQAEHGPDGLAWLVTWSEDQALAVDAHIDRLVAESPRRADLEATLGRGGYTVLVDGPEQAAAVVDVVAPEHLELLVEPAVADVLLEAVSAAGAVFVGPHSPASVGDYLAGPNHVLPTNRTARFASALRVDDFVRHVHAVTVEPAALEDLGRHVVTLAEAEGLPAHAESVRRRWGR